MTHRPLVLVHGRSQQHKDPDELKRQWLDALAEGLDRAGTPLTLDESAVTFPYYGDTLDQLTAGQDVGTAAAVQLRGPGEDAEQAQFTADLVRLMARAEGLTDEDEQALTDEPGVVERWPGDRPTVTRLLAWLDRRPLLSAATLERFTRDVLTYLRDRLVRETIDDGVADALWPGEETVVVGHSLGSVVAYALLRERAELEDWRVPLLVTLGSPLGVREIRDRIVARRPPTRCPTGVRAWFNARDPRDLVALFPLGPHTFPLEPERPAIENDDAVVNETENRHGITGYLTDPHVAACIHAGLTRRPLPTRPPR